MSESVYFFPAKLSIFHLPPPAYMIEQPEAQWETEWEKRMAEQFVALPTLQNERLVLKDFTSNLFV